MRWLVSVYVGKDQRVSASAEWDDTLRADRMAFERHDSARVRIRQFRWWHFWARLQIRAKSV